MNDWKKVRLSELADITMGQSPKSDFYNSNGDGLPFLQGNRTFGDKYPTFDTWTTFVTKEAEVGDVIMSVRAPVGDINITPLKMCLGRGVCGLRHKQGAQEFLYYLLRANKENLINRENGTVFGSINKTDISNLEVQVPSLREQIQIGLTLKAIDDKIENNKKINHHLEQIGQELFEEIYYDGSSAQLGDIISTLESGSRPKGGAEADGIPSIGAENIERFGQYDYTKEKYISLEYFQKLKRGIVHSGDVLLYKDGAYTGKVSMALDDFPHAQCAINEHIFILRPNELAPSSFFLYFLLLQDKNKQALFSRASSKAAQPGLNQTEVKTLPILLPKTEMITKFESTIAPVMHQIAKNANENRRLITLQKALLPKLLSGEISVN